MTEQLVVGSVILLGWLIVSRVAYVLMNIHFGSPTFRKKPSSGKLRVKTLVVLGSGGHTGEMLKLTDSLDKHNYHPIVYVIANTDSLSLERLRNLNSRGQKSTIFENTCEANSQNVVTETSGQGKLVELIPRSREVGQSFFTSVFTTLHAMLYALWVVLKHRPDLIVVNGPGSCVPICLCSLGVRILGVTSTRITFVESLCRVQTLSLTGKILYWCADDFIVQWPDLQQKYKRSKYFGRLV